MTTVSLVECRGPISLRSCGSSNRSLFENRRRLQCYSPEKLVKRSPTPKANVPDIRGVSLSPACVGGVCSSPTRSPAYTTSPVKWHYEYRGDDFSGSVSSSDEFSDEDLGEVCGSQEVARMLSHHRQEDLQIVGSKPRLHNMFEVPVIKPATPKKPYINQTPQPEVNTSDYNFDRECTSPENPPPSPINYRPSLDGFVVGGKKMACPEKTNFGSSYSVRDFTPGFVKYPLHHCKICEARVMDEEQSQVALERRQSEFFRSRASPYRRDGSVFMSGLSYRSYRSPTDLNPGLLECEHDARSFVEIYTEKKKQKEERDKETETMKKELKKQEKQSGHSPVGTSGEGQQTSNVPEKPGSNSIVGADVSSCNDNEGSKDSLTTRQFIQAVRRSSESRIPSLSDLKSESSRLQVGNISDLSLAQTVQGQETPNEVKPKAPVLSDSKSVVLEKCQVRRCWSDIWPFRENPDVKKSQLDFENMEEVRPNSSMEDYRRIGPRKSRISPRCPLPPCSSPNKYNVETSKSRQSMTSSPYLVISSTEVNAEIKKIEERSIDSPSEDETAEDPDITLTATVIVPSERTCTQWITFNTDQEPVLNNAPVTEGGCDNFLKRLQRTKLYPNQDSFTSFPTGQFCFEPVTDKRYNRWKRRRRKKKETEHRRSNMTVESDSTDEDESEMERIIGHMYEEIHGPPPETPNGTSDTPRMRNRRRRRHLASRSETKLDDSAPDSSDLHYDASSEWMTSDKSDDDLIIFERHRRNSSQRTERHAFSAGCQRRPLDSAMVEVRNAKQASVDQTVIEQYPPADEYKLETSPKEEDFIPEKSRSSFDIDDTCTWPYLEQYREELMERVKSSPTDDIMNKEWLPEIPNPTSPISHHVKNKSEADRTADWDLKPVEQDHGTSDPTPLNRDPVIKMRDRSDSVSSGAQPKTKSKGRIPLNLPSSSLKDSKEYSKLIRKPRQLKKLKSTEETPRAISRSSASNWSELGVNPKQPKHIGVVSVGGSPDLHLSTSSFTASLRPVRPEDLPSPQKTPIKSDLKANNAPKKKELSLPKLSKPVRALPIVRRRNSLLNTERNLKKATKPETEQSVRAKTMTPPKQPTRKIANTVDIDPQSQFIFRDYYLRKLYGKKMRLNSHVKSISKSTQVKQTLTVDRLDIANRKPVKRPPQEEEGRVSNLSFTRAFTFSMFDLPDVYRLYNKRIERKAELADSTGSL